MKCSLYISNFLEDTSAAAAKSLQSCLTVRPHRWQPTRLCRPWDSPGKNTGVGYHFLPQKLSLVFLILLLSSISLHCSFKKAFLSFLAILWNSEFSWVCLSLSPSPFVFLVSSAFLQRETVLNERLKCKNVI